jgi:hypothetical protein
MHLVFFTFKDNLLVLNHVESFESSWLFFSTRDFKSLSEENKLVLSAKRIRFRILVQFDISLTYIRNNKGPNIPLGGHHN